MGTYPEGQILYRAFVDRDRGSYTIEVEVETSYINHVKMKSQYREMLTGCAEKGDDNKHTPGNEYRCTVPVKHLDQYYTPTPIGALEVLRERKSREQREQAESVGESVADIEAISRAIEDDPSFDRALDDAIKGFGRIICRAIHTDPHGKKKIGELWIEYEKTINPEVAIQIREALMNTELTYG